MPFDMTMAEGYLRIRLHGRLTNEVLSALGDAILALEADLPVTPPRLAVAEQRRASTVANPIQSAIVVANPVQYGVARMFQTLNDHPQITVEIFHDRASAIAWLGMPPES